jgi:cation transport ATPase
MYPEKPKREPEKPKRNPQQAKHRTIRFILALLIIVPALFFILPRFNNEAFFDMILLTIMITSAIILCYEIALRLLYNLLNMGSGNYESLDSPHESPNR